jgi:hypothetical protein
MHVLFLFLVLLPGGTCGSCADEDWGALLNVLIPTFGSDCPSWASLFTHDAYPRAGYYHQHSGFHHSNSSLISACEGYASFCPSGKCSFVVAGNVFVSEEAGSNRCHLLVPYLWAEIPAKAASLEPHSGFEYV